MGDEKETAAGYRTLGGSSSNGSCNPTGDPILPVRAYIDMLRLTFVHEKNINDCALMQVIDTGQFSSDKPPAHWEVKGGAPGKYRHMYRIESGDSSITVGLFLVGGTGRTEGRGFIEFNPQKVVKRDVELLFRAIDCRMDCTRWDFACDYDLPRRRFHLDKGHSCYELYNGRDTGRTEYTGQRNKPGRVKVYDKARELGLPHDEQRTRIEVTCSDSLDWPIVWYQGVDASKSSSTVISVILCAMQHGVPAWELLDSIDDPRARKRYRKLLNDSLQQVDCPEEAWLQCYVQVLAWEQGVVCM